MSQPANANSLDSLLFSRASAVIYLLDRAVASRASAIAIDAFSPASGGLGMLKIVDNGSPIQVSHVTLLIKFSLQPLVNLGLLSGCLFFAQSEFETAAILFDPRLTDTPAHVGYCTVLFNRYSELGNSNLFSLQEGSGNLEALEAMTRLSPYKSIREIITVLRKYSSTGTQSILYGIADNFMRVLPHDIVFHTSTNSRQVSFLQALSVLYRDPIARIFLRGTEVQPRGLVQEISSNHVRYVFDHLPGRALSVDVGKVPLGSIFKAQPGEWFASREGPFPLFRGVYVYVEDKLSSIGDLPVKGDAELIAVVSAPIVENVSLLTELVLVSLREFSVRTGLKAGSSDCLSDSSQTSVAVTATGTTTASTIPSNSDSCSPSSLPTIVRLTPEAIQALWKQVREPSSSAPSSSSSTIDAKTSPAPLSFTSVCASSSSSGSLPSSSASSPSSSPAPSYFSTPITKRRKTASSFSSSQSRTTRSRKKMSEKKDSRNKSSGGNREGATGQTPNGNGENVLHTAAETKRKGRKDLEPEVEEEYNCCKDWTDTGLQIQCDKCLLWQHGLCTGFATHEEVPDPYYCDKCLVAMGVDYDGPDDQGHCLRLRNSRCHADLRKICLYLLFYRSSFDQLSEFVFATEEQWEEWAKVWDSAMEKVRYLPPVVDLLIDLETRLAEKLKIPSWKARREVWLRDLRSIQAKSAKPHSKAKQSAMIMDLYNLVTEFPIYIHDASEMIDNRTNTRKRK